MALGRLPAVFEFGRSVEQPAGQAPGLDADRAVLRLDLADLPIENTALDAGRAETQARCLAEDGGLHLHPRRFRAERAKEVAGAALLHRHRRDPGVVRAGLED